MSRAWLFPIVIASILAIAVAVMGATITDIGPWYHGLAQPRWAPPDATYGMAWMAIYAFTALAGVNGWLAMPNAREREWLLGLFALNGFLNIVWSLLFFRLILVIWRRSMSGAVMLVPYLLWVTFAGYLNMTIVHLNGPFA